MNSLKQRAVNDEQKAARRQAILDAALILFMESDYPTVSMIDVAARAGIAKGTVYLYFKTKEALFLALQTQAFERWFRAIDARLTALTRRPPIDPVRAVVRLFQETLAAEPALTRLIAILHTILEQNVDRETALAFKSMLRDQVLQTGPRLEAALPFLQAGQGARLLLQVHALVIGLQHMAEPAPVVAQLLTDPGLALFKVDFSTEFPAALTLLLRGLQQTTMEV